MRTFFYGLAVVVCLIIIAPGSPVRTALQQYQPSLAVAATHHLPIVQADLRLLMAEQPSLSRIRAARIRPAIAPEGDPILQWDVIAEVVAHDQPAEELLSNQPLRQWREFLRPLLNNECVSVTDTVKDLSVQAMMKRLHIAAFLVCPIMTKDSQLGGAVFGAWEHLSNMPVDLRAMRNALHRTCDRIAILINPPT